MTPTLAWVGRWGVSIASLTGGLLALLVFRRGLPHVAWIVGYLLLLWLLFAILVQTRQALQASERRSRRLAATAADYAIQSLYHGLLLFVLPAYYASTTFGSVNAPFFVLLVALALVTTFDPWYRTLVLPRPWVGYGLFLVSLFAALNVALPLVGVPPFASMVASAFLACTGLAPAMRRGGRETWAAATRSALALGIVVATLVAVGRAWVPPAPLHLRQAFVAWDAGLGLPIEPVTDRIEAGAVQARGLVAYTAIYAPAGLSQPVAHVWRHEGREAGRVPLTVVGGRREGFRTWSRKAAFPDDPAGRWSVEVVTASGQLIGRLRFRVVP